MYHYFAAREIYNVGRVCVAAYVWMTGFGNFSYYYIRKDFSFSRFAQVCACPPVILEYLALMFQERSYYVCHFLHFVLSR